MLSAPQILGVPLLLLANKQDSPNSLSVEEIRNDYEEWYRRKLDSARRSYGEDLETQNRAERIASLDVMGVSALEGYVWFTSCAFTVIEASLKYWRTRCSGLVVYTCSE